MEQFSCIYAKLHRQCSYYSRHLGHIKALIDNDDWIRVVDRSISGHILLLGNSEIINALIMFNTRMFDAGSDTFTVHRLSRCVPTEQEIEEYHAVRMKKIRIEYGTDRYLTARSKFIEATRKLKKSTTISKLKALRNYTLAHNIEPENEPEKATLNDLIELTETLNEVVDLAGYIVDSTRGVYRDFADKSEEETKMLYAALPILRNVETNQS